MKVTIVIDKRSKKTDGTYPVKIRVSEKKTQHYISTSVSVKEENFVSEKIVGCRFDRIYNEKLQTIKAKVIEKLTKSEIAGETINSETIKQILSFCDDNEECFFNDILIEHQNSLQNERTKGVYTQTQKRMQKYIQKKYDELLLKDITKTWLEKYCQHLRENNIKENTISIDCRNIRTIFNRAIDNGQIDASKYPFRTFKIPHAKTIKRSLTIDQLRRLKNAQLSNELAKYRDFFMLSFYLCGMNAIDIMNLPPLTSNRIETMRIKTNQPICITIQEEANEIFDRYKGKDFAIDLLDKYTNYLDYVHLLARNLKKIGDEKGIICKELSIYWARHTWASVASFLDIPERTIATALSHADNSVTGIYINFDYRKVDEANRKVIDFLNEEGQE